MFCGSREAARTGAAEACADDAEACADVVGVCANVAEACADVVEACANVAEACADAAEALLSEPAGDGTAEASVPAPAMDHASI